MREPAVAQPKRPHSNPEGRRAEREGSQGQRRQRRGRYQFAAVYITPLLKFTSEEPKGKK